MKGGIGYKTQLFVALGQNYLKAKFFSFLAKLFLS